MKTITLTQGRVALVDDEDFEWLSQWKWYFAKDAHVSHGYARRKMNGKILRMHVEILKHHGLWIPGYETDHRNGCKLDNRLENLRAVTSAQNRINKRRQRRNRSGHTGVYEASQGKRRSKHEGKRFAIMVRGITLGYFAERQEAVDARKAAEIENFGEFRHDPSRLCPGLLSFCPDCRARLMDLLSTGHATLVWDTWHNEGLN